MPNGITPGPVSGSLAGLHSRRKRGQSQQPEHPERIFIPSVASVIHDLDRVSGLAEQLRDMIGSAAGDESEWSANLRAVVDKINAADKNAQQLKAKLLQRNISVRFADEDANNLYGELLRLALLAGQAVPK
jgi:hypothetical protein